MGRFDYQQKKYSGMYEKLGLSVTRKDDDIIIDQRIKLNLPTSHWTVLETNEKGRGAYGLEMLLKRKEI